MLRTRVKLRTRDRTDRAAAPRRKVSVGWIALCIGLAGAAGCADTKAGKPYHAGSSNALFLGE